MEYKPRSTAVMLTVTGVVLVAMLVVSVLVVGVRRYLAPLPPVQFEQAELPSQVAGSSPAVAWPARGSAAVLIEGIGIIGVHADDKPRPLASVVKVMTALVILEAHPLRSGEKGPTVKITAADVAAYRAAVADDQSAVLVVDGQGLTEYQLLEGLLLPSANNFADILARWDAGSTRSFADKMNARAAALGMTDTRYVDPSGNDPASTGTARDQLLLAQAAMRNEIFAEIVALPQTVLPAVGTVYNVNALIGSGGIIGVKTGSGPEAGGCFVVAANATVGGQPVRVFGAVLGTPLLSDAFRASQELIKAAIAAPRDVQVVAPGQQVGELTTAWGARVPVVAASSASVPAWGGLPLRTEVAVTPPASGTAVGATVGTLVVEVGPSKRSVSVQTAETLEGPGWWWRLTR